jgi:hypothetical protein
MILIPPLALFSAGGRDSSVFAFLLVIGCIVGIPGIIAWTKSAARGWTRTFHAGPALLIPAVFLWTVLSHCTCGHYCEKDMWRIAPFHVAIGAVLWHFALIRSKSDQNLHIAYAILFVPILYFFV